MIPKENNFTIETKDVTHSHLRRYTPLNKTSFQTMNVFI